MKRRKSIHCIACAQLLGWLFFCSFSAQAQSPADLEFLQSKYKEEPAIILDYKEQVKLGFDNGELTINSEVYSDQYFINENLQGISDERIYYNETFDEILEINATALFPHGRKYKKVAVKAFETRSKMSGSIFYHDNYYKEITFPKLETGSRTIVSYKQKIKDPHFLSAFYFSSYIPTLKSEYSVRFPEGIKVNYKVFNDPEGRVLFTETKDGNETVLSWSAQELGKYEIAEGAPPISYYEPHVVAYIDEYEIDGKTENVLSDVRDLYAWYQELIEGVNQSPDPKLKAIADSLVIGKTTDREKVSAIYAWVQGNIKYVAFEDGMSGFIPREAAKVCLKRYGDCKDMASITTEMLRAVKVPAYLTWIGSRDIPYTYSELPTPAVDNHMIAAVKLDGQYEFLDATDSFIPLGLPSPFIQGKEALIGISAEEFALVKVPEVSPEQNLSVDKTALHLEGDKVFGVGRLDLDGFAKTRFLHRYSPRKEEDRESFLQNWLERGHNKFWLESSEVKGADKNRGPVNINFEFSLPSYAKSIGDAIYINLNLDKSLAQAKIETEKRKKVSKEMDFKFQREFETSFAIPEGFEVSYLPENTAFNTTEFGFKITYIKRENEVLLKKKVFVDILYLQEENFAAWNEMIEKLNDAYSEVVVLKK